VEPLEQATIDYIAITRLLSAYADAVTTRAWHEFDDFFLPDATIRVDTVTNPVAECIGGRAIGEFIGRAIERFEFFEFVILNTRVWTSHGGDPDAARGRVFVSELRQDAATGHWSTTYGIYQDTYARTADGWRFASRRYQSMARTGRSDVFALPPLG
jgi:SnoaL-like domain